MTQAVVFKGEDGYWVADCLSLPGCVSQGARREEAINSYRILLHTLSFQTALRVARESAESEDH